MSKSQRHYLRRLLKRAYRRQAGYCFYCGSALWRKAPADRSASKPTYLQCTAEHLVPASAGGRVSATNIVAACLFCNQTRHETKEVLAPAEYRVYVQQHVKEGRWHARLKRPRNSLEHSRQR